MEDKEGCKFCGHKAWWFDPAWSLVHLILDITQPWSRDNGGMIAPVYFRKKYPRAVLFTRTGEESTKAGYVRVIFNNPDGPPDFDMRGFWVPSNLLVRE
jgi:hypothetical protein